MFRCHECGLDSRFVAAAVSVEVALSAGIKAVTSAHAPSSSTTPTPAATTPSWGPVSKGPEGEQIDDELLLYDLTDSCGKHSC